MYLCRLHMTPSCDRPISQMQLFCIEELISLPNEIRTTFFRTINLQKAEEFQKYRSRRSDIKNQAKLRQNRSGWQLCLCMGALSYIIMGHKLLLFLDEYDMILQMYAVKYVHKHGTSCFKFNP